MNMRMIARFRKGAGLKFTSHLDVQRTLQRAFRRAGLPLAYSNGFNPHVQLSFASALGTGTMSESEWFDVELTETVDPAEFVERVNAVMPPDMAVADAFPAPEGFGSLSARTRAADYDVCVCTDRPVDRDGLETAIAGLLSGEIIVEKRTKGGIRPVDIRPQILKVSVTEIEGNNITLRVLGRLQADGGLRVEHLLDALSDRLDAHWSADICRTAMYFAGDGPLPRQPADEKEKEK